MQLQGTSASELLNEARRFPDPSPASWANQALSAPAGCSNPLQGRRSARVVCNCTTTSKNDWRSDRVRDMDRSPSMSACRADQSQLSDKSPAGLGVQYFNPISIWVSDECQPAAPASQPGPRARSRASQVPTAKAAHPFMLPPSGLRHRSLKPSGLRQLACPPSCARTSSQS